LITAPLATRYRPKRFADLVGQNHVRAILQAMVAQQQIPPALIFSGTRGVGKTTTARIFAAALNCTEPPEAGEACGACAQCRGVQGGNSTSVLEIDAASSGGIDEVRRIKDLVLYGHAGDWRVVLLDEAQSMTQSAYNALLKVLEEPPAQTVFVLVTTEPEKVLGTVRSRSMPFEFRRIKNSDLSERLAHVAEIEGFEASSDLFAEIAKHAQGGLRDGLMVLDQVTKAGVRDAAEFRDFFGIQDYSLPLLWSALTGNHAEGLRLVDEHFARTGEAAGMVSSLSRLVSELLIIKSEGRPKHYTESALADRVELARALSVEALVRVTEILWDLRTRTRATENDQRSTMELAFTLIAHAVKPLSSAHRTERTILPPSVEREEPPQRLSFADLQNSYSGG
jgi:DNA polymerase-3 subunit gamma/tau